MPAEAAPPPAKRPRPGGDSGDAADPINAALDRLAPHFVGPPATAARALDLLTRLLSESGPALGPTHAPAVLGALCAATGGDPGSAWAPGKTAEAAAAAVTAGRLWRAVDAARPALWPENGGAGTPAPPALAALGAWSGLRAALATDDSFALADAVGALTAAVEALPRPLGGGADAGTAAAEAEAEAEADAASSAADLAAAPARARAAGAAAPAAVSWTPRQADAAHRMAILDAFAFLTGPGYARPWARAAADAAVAGPLSSAAAAGAFGPDGAAQAEAVRALQRAVAAGRAARGAGRRPEGGRGDGGSGFEADRARWVGAAVSGRGSVGGGGGGGGGGGQILGGG